MSPTLRVADRETVCRPRFEQMRIRIRVFQDRRDGDVIAADLLREWAIDSLPPRLAAGSTTCERRRRLRQPRMTR